MVNIVDLDLETTKQYLRVEYEEDDQLIEMMIVSAKSKSRRSVYESRN